MLLRKLSVFVFSLWISLFATFLLQAQPLCDIETYSYEDGFSHNNITQILQDNRGLMWIASWNGLYSFDGYTFTNYRPQPGDGTTMNNARINTMKESSSGNIWCVNQDQKAYLFDVNKECFLDVLMLVEMEMYQNNKVQRIYPLKKGITWILCDGENNFRVTDSLVPRRDAVQVYSSYEHKLKGSTIYTVVQDSEGDEWILTDKGVNIIGSKKIDSDYPFQYIKEMDGAIWLASDMEYLARYDMKTEKLSFLSLPPTVTKIYTFNDFNDSHLYIGTNDGIWKVHTRSRKIEQLDVKVSSGDANDAEAIYKDSYQDLWIFNHQAGIIHLTPEGKKERLYSPRNGVIEHPQTIRFDIFEDPHGCLWLCPNQGNLCYYDRKDKCLKNTFVQQNIISTYGSYMPFLPNIRMACMDKQGNYWIAASNIDLCKMSFYEKHFDLSDNLRGVEIRAIYLDKSGRQWVAGKDKMLRVYEKDGRVKYVSSDGVLHSEKTAFGYNVYAILEDLSGNIWLGTRSNGLYRMIPQKDNRYKVSFYQPKENDHYSLNGESVYSIYQDSQQRIWVGTYENGLNLVDEDKNGEIRFLHKGNRLKSFSNINRVRHITESKDGVILMASSEGLITFSSDFDRPEEIKVYCNSRRPNDATSLSGNELMYIYEDSREDIYLMTQNAGINKIVSDNLLSEDITMEIFSEKKGLASDLTQSMQEDASGMLWVVSKYAISKFDPLQKTFENFGKYTFKETLSFSEASIIFDSDSCIAVGTDKGILRFPPNRLKKDQYVPDLIITGLKVQNEDYEHNPDLLEQLVLEPSQRNLSIRYAALDYMASKNIHYAYKMEGVDKDWNEVGNSRTAQYTNLPDGEFCFLLTSTNSDGEWTGSIKRLPIVVKPAFKETFWPWILLSLAVILIVMLIMSVVFTIYRLRHKVNMEQQLSDIKLRFFTDVSHEFRTPLSLIAGPVNEILENETVSPPVRKHLELVQKNTDRLLHLVNQILDFRKIQNKKMKVILEYTDIVALTRKIMDNFTAIAQEKKMHFEMLCDDAAIYIWVDRDKYEKILFNLLSNAFKYTHDEKSVSVKLYMSNKAYVSVIDEGIGIPAKKIDSIFNRFEMMDDKDMQQRSSGIGLSLVKELLNLLHADIVVNSKLGVGSEFKVAFCMDKQTFEKDDYVEFILKDEKKVEGKVDVPLPKTSIMETETESNTNPLILVVEDNEEMCLFLQDILSKNYQVITASNGKEGLEKAMTEVPDLIVSDVMMPVMDGLDMVKAIKEDNDICHIPIIILSAKSSLDDRIAGLEKGIDDYITKPFSSSYLRTKIKTLLKQRKSLQEAFLASLSVGDSTHFAQDSEASNISLMPSRPNITSFDETFIQSMMSFMEENMTNEDLTVEELAEAMRMSRTVFYKKVKSLLGVSPVDFIKDIRVKRAAQLIEAGNMSLSEVAYNSGFSDPNYFSKCFKKQMGMTPSRYKEKCQESRASR